jgi:hypothetical protein
MNQDRALLVVLLTAIAGGAAYATYGSWHHDAASRPTVVAAAPSPISKCQELRTDCDPKTGLTVVPTRAPTPAPAPSAEPTVEATDRTDCNRCDPDADATATPEPEQEAYGPGPDQETETLDRPIRVSILAKETQPDGLYIQKCDFKSDHSNWLAVDFKVQNYTDHVVNSFEINFDAHANPYGWTDFYSVPQWFGETMLRIPPHHYFEATHVMQFLPHTDIIHCYLKWWLLDGERGE